jgi:hypothetical protein
MHTSLLLFNWHRRWLGCFLCFCCQRTNCMLVSKTQQSETAMWFCAPYFDRSAAHALQVASCGVVGILQALLLVLQAAYCRLCTAAHVL